MGLMLAEPGFHTRAFVEWEEYPRAALIAGQRAGYLAPAPIWDDLTTFDARPFAGAFDTVLAGYPCQPFSQAGQRRGADDERHLWPDVARVIGELGPGLRWVFLENVAGHVTLGLETVLRELRDLGFTPAAGLFTAAETGAPHERERVFIVAYRSGERRQQDARGALGHEAADGRARRVEREPYRDHLATGTGPDVDDPDRPRPAQAGGGADQRGDGNERGQPVPGDGRGTVGDPARIGRGEGWSEPDVWGGRDAASGDGSAVDDPQRLGRPPGRPDHSGHDGYHAGAAGGHPLADAGQPGLEGRERHGAPDEWHRAAASGPVAQLRRPQLYPPGPADMGRWAATFAVAPYLAPAASFGDLARFADQVAAMAAAGLVEEAAAEPAVRRMADGLAARSRALRLLGNGVVPLVTGYAWRTLAAAHGLRPVDLGGAGGGPCGDTGEPVLG